VRTLCGEIILTWILGTYVVRTLCGEIILTWIFNKWDGGAWIGLIWLRIGTGGGLL
jgi:hypothetical protein